MGKEARKGNRRRKINKRGESALLPAGALGAVSWIPVPLAGPAPGPFAACFGASASFVGASILAFIKELSLE